MQKFLDSFKFRKYQVNPEGGMIYVDHKVEKWLNSFKNGNFSGKTDQEIDIYKRITKSGIEDDQECHSSEIIANHFSGISDV